MTISISSLNQNTRSDQPLSNPNLSPKPSKKENQKKTSHIRSRAISRPIAARRRRGIKVTDEEDEDELPTQTNGHTESDSSSSSSSDELSISSLANSDEDDDDDDDDDHFDDDDDDNDEKKNSSKNLSQDQVGKDKMRQKNTAVVDVDDDSQFQFDPDDLEAGLPQPVNSDSQPSENLQNHSDPTSTTHDSLVRDLPTTKPAQDPLDTSSHSHALSPPAPSAHPNNARRSKQQQASVAVSSQPLSTAIIFNQASWVTGLSAALAATTAPSNNNTSSTDDQPVQTPRYIPYIEFENYSAYGNLIFDLNSGLGRTARVDCKPDGLEKAPPEALEEQFVRIQPSHDQPSYSGQPSNSSSGKGSRRKSTLPVNDKPDLDHMSQDEQEDHQAPRRGKKSVSLSDKNKKKKKKKKDSLTRLSPEAHGDEAQNEPSDQRFKIKIISPPSSSSKNRLSIKASSTSVPSQPNSTSNRPPSSLASGLNRPSSAFSCAAHSEGNRSASASEAHSLEPWAVPRSGRFWGHDDRQSYSHRRGGRGGFVQNRGGSAGARGSLRKRAGFRADWPSTPPSSRRSMAGHGSTRRPETPAGQSDASRSVGSGAGWITVPSKPKGFGAGFHQNRHSQLNSQKYQSDKVDSGEWRHDGWEEIEREVDRKPHPNHRGRGGAGGNHQSRGGAGWKGGAPSAPTRRPNNTSATTPSNQPSQAHPPLDTSVLGGKADKSLDNSPNDDCVRNGQEADEVKLSANSTPSTDGPQINAQDSSPKLVNGGDSRKEEEQNTDSIPISEIAIPSKQSSNHSESPAHSDNTSVTSTKLTKTIKIGTIPVYPPVTLQSVVTKNESTKPKVLSSPIDPAGSSVLGTDQSPSTPELSDTPQVSRSASTLDEHPSPHPCTTLTPVISTESASGSITLGSVGGAEVLREAMSTPKILLPSHTTSHDSMIPQYRVEHPMGVVNSFGHSRTSSFSSHTFPPASFGPHPDFVEQSHSQHPPPLNLPSNHHPPHLTSSATYHNPIPAPPQTTIHAPSHLYQPPLPALPPLQYFDPNNHNLGYSHPPSLGPPPINNIYGGYMPPPPPQLAPPRSHPPQLYHPPPPQSTAFEHTPPPLPHPPPPSAPVTGATPSGMILPGHFAPPKSTKVRITNPGSSSSGSNLLVADHHPQNFHYHFPNHTNQILPDTHTTRSTDPSQIKTTETGINYYEHNGVTYFGDCIPPITSSTTTTGTPMNDSIENGSGKLRGGNADVIAMNMGMNEGLLGRNGNEFRSDDPYGFFDQSTHPAHHHQYQTNGALGHGFDISGHSIESSLPHNLPISINRPVFTPAHHPHPASHVNHSHGLTGSSGQVVLSQVIRPPSIPFG